MPELCTLLLRGIPAQGKIEFLRPDINGSHLPRGLDQQQSANAAINCPGAELGRFFLCLQIVGAGRKGLIDTFEADRMGEDDGVRVVRMMLLQNEPGVANITKAACGTGEYHGSRE